MLRRLLIPIPSCGGSFKVWKTSYIKNCKILVSVPIKHFQKGKIIIVTVEKSLKTNKLQKFKESGMKKIIGKVGKVL